MKKQQIAFPFVLAHTWVLIIFFGALVFDTLIVYPNTFHDVPRSLETAMAFATVRGPGSSRRKPASAVPSPTARTATTRPANGLGTSTAPLYRRRPLASGPRRSPDREVRQPS